MPSLPPDKEMEGSEKFKVIIAGGGIAGLTLANMLEKFDIDYLLLESHGEVAPPVGASLGLFPNGLRILDQIGCFEPIMQLPREKIQVSYSRDGHGKIQSIMYDMADHLQTRHGYPMLFFDRHWLLQVLYDQLVHKQRIMLNKKVSRIDIINRGVVVKTADGDEVTGSLIIGADGIHSTVRSEMFRLGYELQPGYFSIDEEEKVAAYYKCSFGIAKDVPGWKGREQHVVTGNGTSQLVVSGPENRVYWFLFVKFPSAKYGKEIPKFNKQDEEQFAQEYINLAITEDITFGQVYAKRLSSTLTAVHEMVYNKWSFRRIMILGDAAHKPNPIGGQGGNGAIESCAELVNAILAAKKSRPMRLDALTDEEVMEIFKKTQDARHDRAQQIVNVAHDLQSLNAFENPLISHIILNIVSGLAGDEFELSMLGGILANSTTLKSLPIPYRSRVIPFHDELPSKPMSRTTSRLVMTTFLISMSWHIWSTGKSWRPYFVGISYWSEFGRGVRIWVGSSILDQFVSRLASVISFPIFWGQQMEPKFQLAYFSSQLISPLLVYTIEGYRLGNQGTLLSLPSVAIILMQARGIGCTVAAHAALTIFQGHELPTGRFVRHEVAKSLLPALTLGYIIPTILVLIWTSNERIWQHFAAIWYSAPFLFSPLTWALSRGIWHWERRSPSPKLQNEKYKEETGHFDRYKCMDVAILKSAYKYAFVLQATAHMATFAYHTYSTSQFDLSSTSRVNQNLNKFSEITTSVQFNQSFDAAAIVASNIYSLWDLRRLGYIKTKEMLRVVSCQTSTKEAYESGHDTAKLVRELLSKRKADIHLNAKCPGSDEKYAGMTPLHLSALILSEAEESDEEDHIFSHAKSINEEKKSDDKAKDELQEESDEPDDELLKLLLDFGADPNARDVTGSTRHLFCWLRKEDTSRHSVLC